MLTPEPADKVKGPQGPAGEPRVAARATEAAAPVRLLPTAELSSRQRSEQMDAVVEQVVKLNDYTKDLRGRIVGTNAETGRHFREVERTIDGLIARVNELEAQWGAAQLKQPQSFGQRVRWMVLGR